MNKTVQISNQYGFTMTMMEKISINTSKSAKKTQNISKKATVYFSIDDENPPVRGVKDRGVATIINDLELVIPIADRNSLKYLGTLDHHIAKMISEKAKKGKPY